MGASEIMKIIVYAAATITSALAIGTLLISLKYRKEIFVAERRRAMEKMEKLYPSRSPRADDHREEIEPMVVAQR